MENPETEGQILMNNRTQIHSIITAYLQLNAAKCSELAFFLFAHTSECVPVVLTQVICCVCGFVFTHDFTCVSGWQRANLEALVV